MKAVVTGALLLAALFHLLPAVGVLGAERLASLYGVAIADPALLVLMRHRALLFGVVGAFMLHAAWAPALQPWAIAAGLASTVGFVALAAGMPALRMIVWIDAGLIVALAVAAVLRLRS
jgi:hypothetical protein